MVEAGLVDKWHRDEVTNFKMKLTADQRRKESLEAGTNEGQVRVAIKPLALDHLQVGYGYYTYMATVLKVYPCHRYSVILSLFMIHFFLFL